METYIPHNVCSRKINFEIADGKITKCEFIGGCTGNTQGVSKLVIGMTPQQVTEKLQGIVCRGGTSCPDQLAQALKHYIENSNN